MKSYCMTVTIGEKLDSKISVSKLVELYQMCLEHTMLSTDLITQSLFKDNDVTIAQWTFTIAVPDHSFDYVWNFLHTFSYLEITYH